MTRHEEIQDQLKTAPAALQPIIAHHARSWYGECDGCDSGQGADNGPEWPCSTIELIISTLATPNKHLTDTELAAEYWSACNDYETGAARLGFLDAETFERFATRPHASENGYQ